MYFYFLPGSETMVNVEIFPIFISLLYCRWTHDSKHYQSKGHIKQDSMDASNWSEFSQSNPCGCPPHIKSLKPLERKRLKQGRCIAHSLVGTPNYIAPEVFFISILLFKDHALCLCVYVFAYPDLVENTELFLC